ncbi:Hypothetical predicted protein [Paramuricea clavata]|uniref:Uncharacterized protein n=1 Tax=Paramuricea clavata TaxID=317549 RepID=A0A7D9I6E7_PARCT|nr:Hypothetical predicted protein [Paramuricea clavata]
MSVKKNIDILLQHVRLGVKPTKFCTCTDNELRENKFVRSLSELTTLVNGRIQKSGSWLMKVLKIPSEKVDHSKPEWYLPLYAVFTPEKTTKVRLVFESSCEGHDGLSLNDHLEKGPNYIDDIPEVLAAWRWDNIACVGDMRKMFNQILRNQPTLWIEKPTDEPTDYQWLRLSFCDKPAPDIASKSIKVLAKATQPQELQAAAELLQHVCVDDVAGSRSTVQEVQQVTTAIDSILENDRFEIKTWHSNSTEIDQTEEFDRKLKPINANGLPEIHGFSDAGDQAYGAVLFLRWELIDGSFVCVPVIIKAFVAPAKKKSIPVRRLNQKRTKTQKKQPKDKKVHVYPTVNAKRTAKKENPENQSQEKTTESKAEEKVNPRDMIRSTEKRVNDFWCCWMKYFASNILPRNKWFRTRKNVKEGDLVLELDSKHKRCQWKMAIIIGTYPGPNKECRWRI